MTELILFSLFILAVFCAGLFVGYSLSRRRDDKPIITIPGASSEEFTPDVSPWERSMVSDDEYEEQKVKREATIL